MRRLAYVIPSLAATGTAALLSVGAGAGCSNKSSIFTPVPECQPSLAVTPLKGDRQMVVSSIAIGTFDEGFDLNGDGKPDNKLSPIGALANDSIKKSFASAHDVVIPVELYGYTGADSACTKMSFYLGRYNEDRDGDSFTTTWDTGSSDCDDTNPAIHPGATENTMNRVDDDCDGFADNPMKGSPPSDTQDLDGDGQTLAQGDCDDRANNPIARQRHKGAMEICGNGIDDDCDGIVDNGAGCDPYAMNKSPFHVQALSFQGDPMVPAAGTMDASGFTPLIKFPDGNVKGGVLSAGPDLFQFTVPVKGIDLTLALSGAHVQMTLVDGPNGTSITQGKLGGVIEAVSMAQVKNLSAGNILSPEQSLLDAVFVGPLATILGLDSDKDSHYLPDIDVDGDGLETFWQEATTTPAIVDTCKDGDGTIIRNKDMPGGMSCALAKDGSGNYRFVDGLSVALKLTAVPAKLVDVTPK